MGPKQVRSTVLSIEEKAATIALRRHTLLLLEIGLYVLQSTTSTPDDHPCIGRVGRR